MMDKIVQVHIFNQYIILCISYNPDIIECDDNNGGCSQLCNNSEGSYECYCRNGYVLDSDGHNCSGTYISS